VARSKTWLRPVDFCFFFLLKWCRFNFKKKLTRTTRSKPKTRSLNRTGSENYTPNLTSAINKNIKRINVSLKPMRKSIFYSNRISLSFFFLSLIFSRFGPSISFFSYLVLGYWFDLRLVLACAWKYSEASRKWLMLTDWFATFVL